MMTNNAPLDVLTELRLATADRHAELDSGLPLSGAQPTLQDYRDHLLMLRAWLGPLECWLAGFDDGPQDERTLPLVLRTPLIDADLHHPLMPQIIAAPSAAAWPQGASPAYRWGVCYVVEGSQLGGAVLYQRLQSALAPHPLAYLRSEADGPGPRWRTFMQALRAQVRSAAAIAQACQGARDAFDHILALAPLKKS